MPFTYTRKLSDEDIANRLFDYISLQVYDNWDYGMTLADVEEYADTLNPEDDCKIPMDSRVLWALEETLEEYFEPGFPNGGMPPELRAEIETRVEALKPYFPKGEEN